MKIKLAEALLRRKELGLKVGQLSQIKQDGLFEVKVSRKPAHEGVDDIIAQVPKISIEQVTASFDWHSRRLRMVDSAIQQANWNTEIEVDDSAMKDYEEPKKDSK